jgi:phosphoribosylformylglycinamidine (FGAM) synthase-like enzyme
VAEAARNLVCTGAEPLAITDCLNLGNPEKNDIYYQLKECIRGMARACRQLDIPVISGNVSLYNETKGKAIYPTPVIGMVGLIEDVNRHCTNSFKDEGDVVFLLGSQDEGGLGGSEYLEVIHGLIAGGPFINLDLEKRVQRCCLSLIKEGIIKSAHDCSDGGLAVALAECCLAGDVGFRGGWGIQGRIDAALFGELQSRIIVSVAPTRATELEERATQEGIGLGKLGVVGGKRLIIEGVVDVPLEQMAMMWHNGLDWALKGLSKGGVDEPGRGSNLS